MSLATFLVIDANPWRRSQYGNALTKTKPGAAYLEMDFAPTDLSESRFSAIRTVCYFGLILSREEFTCDTFFDAKQKTKKIEDEQRNQNKQVSQELSQRKRAALEKVVPPVKKPAAPPEPEQQVTSCIGYRVGSLSWHMEQQRLKERKITRA